MNAFVSRQVIVSGRKPRPAISARAKRSAIFAKWLKFIVPALSVTFLTASIRAGVQTNAPREESVAPSPFAAGTHELQLGLSYNISTSTNGPLRPAIGDLDANLRCGWMLNSPGGNGFFRGNCEFLVEAVAGGFTVGPGAVIAGGTLIFRYNFIQPSARWIPYIQAGLGAVYTDAYRQRPQRLLGEAFEFTAQGEIGVRYQLTPHTSVYAETGYRHISNAGLADRNYGLNSVAAQAGMSWLW